MIQKQRLLDSFLAYVQIDSESKSEEAMARRLQAEMEEIGCETYVDKAGETVGGDTGNLYCVLPGDPALDPLIFTAHMDTVKPGRGVKPVIRDGVIYSDGSTVLGGDDKVGVAAIVETFRVIQENKLPHPTLTALFTIHEEGGLLGSQHLEYERLQGNKAFVLDSSGAPGKVIISAPGQMKLNVTIQGRTAHAGVSPESGISAIQAAAEAISHMNLLRIDEETTANIGTVKSEFATNVVPDQAVIIGEVRSRNNQKLQDHAQHMLDCVKQGCERFGATFTGGLLHSYSGYTIDPESDIIRLIRRACEHDGLELVLAAGGGGSDANNINLHGISAVPLGTGMTKVHTTGEQLSIAHMEQLTQLVLTLATQG